MKFVVRNRNDFLRVADQIAPQLTGDPYQVTVKPFQRDRSGAQNARMHAMIRDLALHVGYSEPQMKDVLKAEAGPFKVAQIGDRTVEAPKPTSEYTVEEMGFFIDELFRIGAEVSCVFTEP